MILFKRPFVAPLLSAALLLALVSPIRLAAQAPTPQDRPSQDRRANDEPRPHILMIAVDTLRYDRLSFHGAGRPTSPQIDKLLSTGASFDQARVVEPLTAPSMISMITSLQPHEHGASRNGIPMRERIPSIPKVLDRLGYRTAAFVGNWTLRDKVSGLGEHFDDYQEVLTKKRWFGLLFGEADADDLTDTTLEWVDEYFSTPHRRPMFLWTHYVDPHAPYVLHEEHAAALGIPTRGEVSKSDRYDTEVAFVDHAIGELIAGVRKYVAEEDLLVIFVSDHGENLGEHDYWGHGRYLWEENLKVPMSFTWKGRIPSQRIDSFASTLDLGPTLLGLLDLPVPEVFEGFDWSPLILRGEKPPQRTTYHQAHKGAAQGSAANARKSGLLEVALVGSGGKEVYRLKNEKHQIYEILKDPGEKKPQQLEALSPEMQAWLKDVREGLSRSDHAPVPELDPESIEKLRALGYID